MQRKLSRLHFVGIGGIGMAGLAELLHAQGFHVTGSDVVAGATVARLRELGLEIAIGHAASAIADAETVVRSSAIAEDNIELATARERGIPIVGRGALLAEIMRTKDAIAVGGSHGKTTTSAMTAHLLEHAGLDPTALIGGRVPRASGSASPVKLGHGDLIVAEVDESDGSFLLTRPIWAVVSNIDPEHLEHYGSREALLDAFVTFANAVPFWGAALLGIDHPGVAEIAARVRARQIRFGFDTAADVRALAVAPDPRGQRCRARLASGEEIDFLVPMPGRHNVLNALAAIAVGHEQGIAAAILAEAIESFPGVARRFERRGTASGVEIIDDYAHHPAEIRALLAAARSVHAGPITAIFQPHRFSRTRDCWDAFLEAFGDADRVVLADIYPASERPLDGIDSERLSRDLRAAGHPEVAYGGSLDAIERSWPERFTNGELVLTIGAGDVAALGPKLLEVLRSNAHAAKGEAS